MSVKLEIERKFLVKFPTSWETLVEMFDNLIDIKRISQTYLKPKGDEPSGRIRKTIQGLTGDKEVNYEYNQKKLIEKGVHEEKELKISKKQYEELLEQALPNKITVSKTRFVFKYLNQVFELDVFKGPLTGLAILEIELPNKNKKIELPPFLKIKKEVTDNSNYTNFYLASKQLFTNK